MKIWLYLELAAETARRDTNDVRCHAHGSVGIRKDGAIVRSRNGHSKSKIPEAHAEARLCDKLDYGAPVVFVARVRKSGEYGMSMPCPSCMTKLRQKGVKKVYFTTNEKDVYGVWDVQRGYDSRAYGANQENS